MDLIKHGINAPPYDSGCDHRRSRDDMGQRIAILIELLCTSEESDLALIVRQVDLNVTGSDRWVLADDSNIDSLLAILRQRAVNLHTFSLQIKDTFSWTDIRPCTAQLLNDLVEAAPISILNFSKITGIPYQLVAHCYPDPMVLDLEFSTFAMDTAAIGAAVTDQFDLIASLPSRGRYHFKCDNDGRLVLIALRSFLYSHEGSPQLAALLRARSHSLETISL